MSRKGIQVLETELIGMWELTTSVRGCRTVVWILKQIAEYAEDDEIEDLLFCQNLAFSKGQSLQLIENQRAYIGKL